MMNRADASADETLPQLAVYRNIGLKLRAHIAWPRRFRQECELLGLTWPGGLLLTGPPGVGKTTLVQRAVMDVGGQIIHVGASDIVGSQLGGTERRLRDTFRIARQAAQNQTVVIFLDELDALCPKRTMADSHESRVVAQLLTLMDGVSATKPRPVCDTLIVRWFKCFQCRAILDCGHVRKHSRNLVCSVIAATNRIEAVDVALRRPGRFDTEIVVPLPDESARLAMLQEHAESLRLCQDVDLARLARICHGYTCADIKALCRESLMLSLGSSMAGVSFLNLCCFPHFVKASCRHVLSAVHCNVLCDRMRKCSSFQTWLVLLQQLCAADLLENRLELDE